MDQSRKALENEPVLFIAICSGLKPSSVTAYMKSVKSEMAAYADVDRSYEAAVLKATINLKNVHQTMLMKPDGSTHIIGQDNNDIGLRGREHWGGKWNPRTN